MRKLLIALVVVIVVVGAGVAILWPWASPPEITATGDPERGAYVLRMGGCIGCHTDEDGVELAGGLALPTEFGTFYTSNITPDSETGIGGWSTGDFVLAMTEGVSPGGAHYYPSFPYTDYTRMTEQDLIDLKAHLDTIEPVVNEVPAHELAFPFNIRLALGGWKLLFFERGTFEPDASQSEAWNRGAYLVNGPGHCGECHTPRNALGATIEERFLAGSEDGPEGKPVPSIRPSEDGIGDWSKGDITFALQTGILPDGDVVGSGMGDVVEEATSHLRPEDLDAIGEYLLSLPPLAEE